MNSTAAPATSPAIASDLAAILPAEAAAITATWTAANTAADEREFGTAASLYYAARSAAIYASGPCPALKRELRALHQAALAAQREARAR